MRNSFVNSSVVSMDVFVTQINVVVMMMSVVVSMVESMIVSVMMSMMVSVMVSMMVIMIVSMMVSVIISVVVSMVVVLRRYFLSIGGDVFSTYSHKFQRLCRSVKWLSTDENIMRYYEKLHQDFTDFYFMFFS